MSAPAGPTVSAQVTGAQGWPVPGLAVTVLGPDGASRGRGHTDDEGRLSITLSPGPGPITLVLAGAGVAPIARTLVLPADGADLEAGVIALPDAGGRREAGRGRWALDPDHTIIKATARHLGFSRIEGRFTEFDGVIEIADPIETSAVTVSIATASLTTGSAMRDGHLKSADFLDVERFPALTFRSTTVRDLSGVGDRLAIEGELTIRDVARPVTLDATRTGTGPDPWGGTRTAFSATTTLNRRDFEMDWNMGIPGGLLLLGPTLTIDLDVQAVLQA